MKKTILFLLIALGLSSSSYAQLFPLPQVFIGGVVTTPILFSDGTNTAPSISFATDTQLGFAHPGSGIIGINSLAAERIRLDVSNGYVVLASGGKVRWTSGSSNGSQDTDIGRSAAGVISYTTFGVDGTQATLVGHGELVQQRNSYTITPATATTANCSAGFFAASVTADCTIYTLAAGQKIISFNADVTTAFTCSGTCVGTKVVQCGISAGTAEVLAAARDITVLARYGLADADMGSGLTRAAAIQGGYLPSWTATQIISCRFTSGTGNWGSGAATFVNAGVIKFILVTEQIK